MSSASCNNQADKLLRLDRIEDTEPLNVIFILSDDHRYDFMGFTEKVPWLRTPNMDRMASEGAHLKNAFVTTSLSSPSRATILTGQYSHVHGVVDNQASIPEGLIFFPEYLQEAGYETSFFGKWHMGNVDHQPQPGFDHWVSFRGQGVYWNPTLNVDGKIIEYRDSTYLTDLLTDYAINWMESRTGESPFFLYLSHKAVHERCEPAKRHRGMYAGNKYTYPKSYSIPEYGLTIPPTYNEQTDELKSGRDFYGDPRIPDWVRHQRESWHGVDPAIYHGSAIEISSLDEMVIDYCETLMSVDESIGRVIEYLEDNGLAESTIVIYMSDNGWSFGEHGLIDKRHFYEESARVPLLAYCPGVIDSSVVIDRLIQNIDIAPTILEAAGLQYPENMQGLSFLPFIYGKETEWRDQIYYEYFWEYDYPSTPTTFGVRSDRYKYIRYHGIWDTNEFFDLQEDPHEINNLIDCPDHQKLIEEYVDALYTWLENTDGMQIPLKRVMHDKRDHRNIGTR